MNAHFVNIAFLRSFRFTGKLKIVHNFYSCSGVKWKHRQLLCTFFCHACTGLLPIHNLHHRGTFAGNW